MSASEREAEPRPHDLRLVPAAVAAWAAMGLATWADPRLTGLLAAGALVVVAGALRARRWRTVAALVVLAVCLATGAARAWELHHDPVAGLARQRAVIEVDVRVTGEARVYATGPGRDARVVAPARVVAVEGRGQRWRTGTPVTLIAGGTQAEVWVGAPVGEVRRLIVASDPPRRGDGVAAVLRARGSPGLVARAPAWLRWAERIRGGLRDAVAGLPAERAGLLPGLVLGDTSRVPPDLDDSFKSTALTHLSAVSGSNLALLLVFVGSAARWCKVRGRALHVIAFGCTAAFVVLCRGEPSVLRAAAMGWVTLASVGSGAKDGAGVRSLCAAVVALLLIDPWLARSWGFALSVAACTGIIAWGRPWAASLRRWAPAWLAESLAIPLAAQLATQPLITALAGSVSLVGLPANALAAPFVGPATVLGLSAALAAPLFMPLARLLAWAGAWCAQVIIWIARWGAGLPGARVDWPATPAALVLLTACCLAAGCAARTLLARRLVVVVLLLALASTVVKGPVRPGWPPPTWAVVACSVGQGDGLVLRVGPGAAVVVDTGPDQVLMRGCLDALGITQVPVLVLTHDHADHTGGIDGVLAGRRVGEVLESPLATPSRARIEQRLRAAGATPRATSAGEEWRAGAVHWQTISTGGGLQRDATGEGESSAENDASIIAVATVGDVRVLVTGDAEPGGQDAALAAGVDLSCDVLKVPHHGSARQSADFLAATHARVALVSVGAKNDYGHPTAKTLRALEGQGMSVLRTDERGALAVWRERGELRAASEHQAVPVAQREGKRR